MDPVIFSRRCKIPLISINAEAEGQGLACMLLKILDSQAVNLQKAFLMLGCHPVTDSMLYGVLNTEIIQMMPAT